VVTLMDSSGCGDACPTRTTWAGSRHQNARTAMASAKVSSAPGTMERYRVTSMRFTSSTFSPSSVWIMSTLAYASR